MEKRTIKLIATLTTENGHPIPGAEIYFYMKRRQETQYRLIGKSKTDSNGKATLETQVEAPETYDFKAVFRGTEIYAPSQDTVQNYIVKGKVLLDITVKIAK